MTDELIPKHVKLRKLKKNKFVIEENLQQIQWPQKCANCGDSASTTDSISMKEKYKGLGEIHMDVKGIPYCATCFPNIRRGKVLNKIINIMGYVLGIPIGIILLVLTYQQETSGTRIIWIGLFMVIGIGIGHLISYLLIKLPVRIFFKQKFVEPVDAWIIQEKKQDGREGVSVVISIPNQKFADEFAQINQ